MTQFFNLTLKMVGILTKDKDKEDVRAGDFIDALNTRSLTDEGQTTDARQNIKGNEYVFKPEQLTVQNKKFRIYISSASAGWYAVRFLYPNGTSAFPFFAESIVSVGNIANTLDDFAFSAVSSIQTAITMSGQTANISTTVTGADAGYIDVEITTVPMWDYRIVNTNPTGTPVLEADIVTIQEAISNDLLGDWNLIGSWDLQGELILWWTTQRNLPEELEVTSVTNNGSGLYRVETTLPHGQTTGNRVVLSGFLPTSTNINGQWIVTVVSATEFDLQASVFVSVPTTLGEVTIWPQGIGELGRAVKNDNDQTWSYIRLIRAKALNWVTKHQMDTLCKKDAIQKYYRYTDDYNPIGNLYDRTVNYQNDCLLSFIDPLNTYSYDNIGQESQFIQNGADYTFEFTEQSQSGGAILSGNSRFAIRLLTDTLVPTSWSPLTNPVPATTASETGAATSFTGNDANVVTTKIDNFLLEGDLVDNYKWAQIAVVNYQGDAITGLLLPRVLITSNSMTLRWTGNEAEEDLDVGTLQEITFGYKTALSIDELDGRIIFSNLTSSNSYNLSGFALSLTHSILREEIPSIGSRYNGTLSINEYMLSENVNRKAGYMINETYRFGLQAEFMDGGTSLTYFVQDIRIDTDAAYPRRIAALPDNNLTDSTGDTVYVPHVEFSGIDWDYLLPTGQRVRDVVRRLRIVRVDMDEQYCEVLASGVFVLGCDSTGTQYSGVDTSAYSNGNLFITNAGTSQISDFPFAEGMRFDPTYLNQDYANSLFTNIFFLGSIYAPDFLYGNRTWTPTNTDVMIDFGQPTQGLGFTEVGHTPTDNMLWNNFTEWTGFGTNGVNRPIAEGYNIGFQQTATFSTGQTYSKQFGIAYTATVPSPYAAVATMGYPTSPVVRLANPVLQPAGQYGFKRVQVYRAKTDKFGEPTLNRYVTTGAEIIEDETSIEVFGGDVFTQKTWFRHRITSDFQENTPAYGVSGFDGGFGIYSQNRVNTEMTNKVGSPEAYKYPFNTEGDWLNQTYTGDPTPDYNSGYNLRNQVQSYASYNPDQSLVASDFPVRLIYGQKANPEQSSDTQRIFLPLDFTDLQYKDGEIVNHRVVNSELCSWQDGYFSRLYFHSNRLITTQSGAEVITGTGAAFSNRPLNITSYGCSNKWAILIGRSAGGNQTAYWISDKLKSFIRFGGDGTTNQGMIHGIDSFLRYNLNLVNGKKTPADNQGINTVWNEAFKEAIFTVRAWREGVEEWDVAINYQAGQAVEYGTRGFEEIPAFYIANSTITGGVPPDQSAVWDLVELSNPLYYNFYSLVFNEIRNGFDGFVSFRPRIYAQYANTILSPRPVSNTGEMYEHGRGNWCWWYDNGVTKQAEDGKTRVVFNADPAAAKEYLALIMWTEQPPYRTNFKTAEHESYLDEADYEFREGHYDAAIQADSTVTTVDSPFGASANPLGLNNVDSTCPIYGNFLEIELIFENGVKQAWSGCVIKGQLRDRKNNT